eukprot:1144916-Pelagomonas_calceolata.AAC.4
MPRFVGCSSWTVWQGYPCLQTGAGMWQLRNKGHLALIMDTIPSFPIKEKQCVAIWSTFTFFEEKETRRKLLRAPFMTHGLATPSTLSTVGGPADFKAKVPTHWELADLCYHLKGKGDTAVSGGGYKGYKGKRHQSRRLTASLFIMVKL